MALKYNDKYVKIHSKYEAILIANQDKIYWDLFSCNPAAIELLTVNQDKIDWDCLSENPAAIELLIANPNKIYWGWLSKNRAAIELLIANPNKIDWKWLLSNPAAIDLLAANQDKIDWGEFCGTPFLEYDYIAIRSDRLALNRELHEYFYHPRFVQRWLDDGNDIEDYMM